jgi:hypothetical protein
VGIAKAAWSSWSMSCLVHPYSGTVASLCSSARTLVGSGSSEIHIAPIDCGSQLPVLPVVVMHCESWFCRILSTVP